jgi:hypothetical protein
VENPSFYLWIGLALGAVVGAGRQENRTLKQRLEKKDKHIQEMMYHTEKIAAGLAEQNNGRTNHGS